VFITLDNGENYEIDVTHNTGYNVYIKGAIIEPTDHIAFIRKDKAINGVDDDLTKGLEPNNSTMNCDAANQGTLALSSIGADDTVNDYGGEVRRECVNTLNGCNPTTCKVYPDTDPLYHEDCRFASEFNMVGVNDTIHTDRHPWDEPLTIGAPPASPPWFDTLVDDHADNGIVPAQTAGLGQPSETYDESGTYYMCFRQDRDPAILGYQKFAFLKYIVIHIHHKP
jgi:hypothetical protein